MLLTAHRVRSRTGAVAIHAFCYAHGNLVWNGEPPPTLRQGVLQASHTVLDPPFNNTVLSFLDIVAPDEVKTPEVKRGFAVVYETEHRSFPWKQLVGRCQFEQNMALGLQTLWRQESIRLFEAALGVWIRFL